MGTNQPHVQMSPGHLNTHLHKDIKTKWNEGADHGMAKKLPTK
jgi:hypothetical protein